MNYIVKDYDGYTVAVLLNCDNVVKGLVKALMVHAIHLSVSVTPVDDGKYGVYDVCFTMKDLGEMSGTYMVDSVDVYDCARD